MYAGTTVVEFSKTNVAIVATITTNHETLIFIFNYIYIALKNETLYVFSVIEAVLVKHKKNREFLHPVKFNWILTFLIRDDI